MLSITIVVFYNVTLQNLIFNFVAIINLHINNCAVGLIFIKNYVNIYLFKSIFNINSHIIHLRNSLFSYQSK